MTGRRRVGLLACCSAKLTTEAPAQDLYVSPLFTKSRAWVEAHTDEWAILSAQHGLVLPDQRLKPYELSLNSMKATDVRAWGIRVNRQIRATWDLDACTFVVLAGAKYRAALNGLEHEVPLRGLGIGQQLRWLTVEVRGAGGAWR